MVCTADFWFAARVHYNLVLRESFSHDILNGPFIFKQFNIGIVSCAISVSINVVTAQNNVTVMY